MAQLKGSSVFKVEVLSVSDYSKKYGNNVTPQALSYSMDNDKLDYVKLGNERFIVMTEKTKQYVPNASKIRDGKDVASTAKVA